LADDLPLSGSGLDSLCLAIIVPNLDDARGPNFLFTDEHVALPLTDQDRKDVPIRVEDGSLRIRSSRVAPRLLGDNAQALRDVAGPLDMPAPGLI
jgi:hypothetical protein